MLSPHNPLTRIQRQPGAQYEILDAELATRFRDIVRDLSVDAELVAAAGLPWRWGGSEVDYEYGIYTVVHVSRVEDLEGAAHVDLDDAVCGGASLAILRGSSGAAVAWARSTQRVGSYRRQRVSSSPPRRAGTAR